MGSFGLKRVYEPPEKADGLRILVDRLWPRGLKKDAAKVDIWAKELAPSAELRRWFHQDAERWQDFVQRYRRELEDQKPAIAALLEQVEGKKATLLYGARDQEHNHAIVLQDVLKKASS